jgi:hypothetical protein
MARPTTVIQREYGELFRKGTNPDLYLKCAKVQRLVEAEITIQHKPSRSDFANLRFYVSMATVCLLMEASRPTRRQIQGIRLSDVTAALMLKAYRLVEPIYKRHGGNQPAAKCTAMLADIKAELVQLYGNGHAG